MKPILRNGNRSIRFPLFVLLTCSAWACPSFCPFAAAAEPARVFRAGAYAIDVSPQKFPVIVNAMFTERTADRVEDPLQARCLVLDDGTNQIAIAIVDTCMMPRDLLDQAKELARRSTGIRPENLLIAATHTHSAPSAMGCLGSRADPDYARLLPDRIAQGIARAWKNLAPAKIGWTVTNDLEHTHNRRWIFRPDKIGIDPFGEKTVRANMHPGHQNPDAIGPSGPVDPGLSILSVQSSSGQPIALLANYSMHYYGSPLLSADYYGRFADKLRKIFGARSEGRDGLPAFVGIMSQGTSGDQMWMDYGKPRKEIGYDAYAEEIAQIVRQACSQIRYHDWVPLVMKEATLTLGFRLADEPRLAWARKIVDGLEGRLPKTLPEIYAQEQIFLHERPTAELKLQALRIGDLGVSAIPNEVFAITGLKVKAQSPLQPTFNIELANGAEGYIPPPEQHKLGGYTTWAARTAGLVPEAEPKIVETVLTLLEQVSGKPRRKIIETHGSYAKAVLDAKPVAYYRLEEFNGPTAFDSTGHHHDAEYEDGIAFYLEGPQAPGFSGENLMNRCAHFAGGRIKSAVKGLDRTYSIEMWFWNGLPTDARSVTGYLLSRGIDGANWLGSDKLSIGGSNTWGKLTFEADSPSARFAAWGKSEIPLKTWNHVVLVRAQQKFNVYLNGNLTPEISGSAEIPYNATEPNLCIGGASQLFNMFEGKIDDVAVYNRALTPEEIAQHYKAAGLASDSRP